MAWLDARIPPPAVAAAVALGMWGLARWLPAPGAALPGRLWIAPLLALAGMGIALAGVLLFRRARTTVHPWNPDRASALVTGGVYRHTRNPMYLGMLLALAGWGFWLGNLAALAGLPAFVFYIDRFQIGPEERALQRLFGEAFNAYCQRVRRWL